MIHRLAIRATALAIFSASAACTVAAAPAGETTATVTSALVVHGGPHLLWQNQTSGVLEAWLLNGSQVGPTPATLSQLRGAAQGCSTSWQAIDTVANSVLWWNKSTGHLRTWNFDSSGNVSIPPDPLQTCGEDDGCLGASHELAADRPRLTADPAGA